MAANLTRELTREQQLLFEPYDDFELKATDKDILLQQFRCFKLLMRSEHPMEESHELVPRFWGLNSAYKDFKKDKQFNKHTIVKHIDRAKDVLKRYDEEVGVEKEFEDLYDKRGSEFLSKSMVECAECYDSVGWNFRKRGRVDLTSSVKVPKQIVDDFYNIDCMTDLNRKIRKRRKAARMANN